MEENNLTPLEYDILEWENHDFTDSSKEKLNAMLTITKEGNAIYICHPRHVFDEMVEDSDTKEVKSVNFDSINIDKMKQYNDFGCYYIVQQICSKSNNQFTYLMRRTTHMIKKYQSDGLSQTSYPLAIIEEIDNGIEPAQYFARGIISCNQDGFSLAFNPLMNKTLPKESVWQKGLRFGDNFD